MSSPLPGLDRGVLIAKHPHGVRVRYSLGCRCDLCRGANRDYERARGRARRKGDWNGLVFANKARHHLLMLSRVGVGRRTVTDISGVSNTIIYKIKSGQRKKIRARTEKAILAVTPDAGAYDGTLVDPGDLLERLDSLRKLMGWTKKELARRFGYKGNAVQFRKYRVRMRTVAKITRFIRATIGRDNP
jgi:hypothetical protein